jgi:group I intron endonuclease
MNKRSIVKRQYKDAPKQAGIYTITNTANGKILLGSSKNLHGPLNRHKFMLAHGSHWNKALQDDWRKFGAEAFKFEVVEVIEPKDDPNFNLDDELTLLEQIWIEKTNPFEKGYNEEKNIRD